MHRQNTPGIRWLKRSQWATRKLIAWIEAILDLGPTCLDYKRFWTTRLEPSYGVQQYGSTARAQSLRLARWLKSERHLKTDDSNQRSKELAAAQRNSQGIREKESVEA